MENNSVYISKSRLDLKGFRRLLLSATPSIFCGLVQISGLLFLRLTHKFFLSQFLRLDADFSRLPWRKYIAASSLSLRLPLLFCIRVWVYPNEQKRTRPDRDRYSPLFGSVATLPMLATIMFPHCFHFRNWFMCADSIKLDYLLWDKMSVRFLRHFHVIL